MVKFCEGWFPLKLDVNGIAFLGLKFHLPSFRIFLSILFSTHKLDPEIRSNHFLVSVNQGCSKNGRDAQLLYELKKFRKASVLKMSVVLQSASFQLTEDWKYS